MATEGTHGPANAAEYIVHHLGSANSSGHPQKAIVDFSIINYDTIFWSVLMGVLACGLMWMVARRVNSGVPNRFVGPSSSWSNTSTNRPAPSSTATSATSPRWR